MAEKNFIIIPAYNEANRITPVIEAASIAELSEVEMAQVMVVDNGSDDETALHATDAGALVISCAERGKGFAMDTGARLARELGATILTFLDADLVGLRPDHVEALVKPITRNEVLMTIGVAEGRPWTMRTAQTQLVNLSGQRSMRFEVWDSLTDSDLQGWRTEAALYAMFRNSDRICDVEYVSLAGLRQHNKFQKERSIPHALLSYAHLVTSSFNGLTSTTTLKPGI